MKSVRYKLRRQGSDIMNILLEYIIVFIGVLIINYFINKFNKNNFDKKVLTPELLYLKKIYKINIKEKDRDSFERQVIVVNSFIITTIYIILMYLLDNWILRIIIGIVLLILMIIICYGLLGRYYRKKED